jgi:hypothetical protein
VKQNQPSDAFIAVEEAEKGMAEMSEGFRETGSELCLNSRQHPYNLVLRTRLYGCCKDLSSQAHRTRL